MKTRRGYVIAALCLGLAAISVHILAVALPFWRITTVPKGDVTQGLWSTCLTYDDSSECGSHSTTEVWLDIVRTMEMMALFLLFLALVGMVVYLLDVSWEEILHAVIVISLLMAATFIIVGIIVYGLNSPMEQLHVSFGLALVAAILALIAAILLLVYPCYKCCQTCRKRGKHNHISVMKRRDRTAASSVMTEREPTPVYSRENTKLSRNSSQFSWRSSSKVEPATVKHTEYIRTTTQISRQTSTPVKSVREDNEHEDCKCCRLCCLFTCCKCCHADKNRKRRTTVKRELHETVCVTCGGDSYQRIYGFDKATSITSLPHTDIATSTTWLQRGPIQQDIEEKQSKKSEHIHNVTTGLNYDNYQPICTNRSTCMTPQHENGERNRKWNHHRSTIIPCGRNVPASAFSIHHGPHAPCPFSVLCCRCKHTIQSKSTENNQNEQMDGRNENYLCDCQVGDIRLCDKCLAKRDIHKVVPRNQNHGQPARAINPNTRVYRSNAPVQSKPTINNQDGDRNKPKNSIDKPQQKKQVLFGYNPSRNDDSSSDFQPSDDDNDSTYDRNEEGASENAEDDNYSYINDNRIYDERKLQNHRDEYATPNAHQTKPKKTNNSNNRNDAKPSRISGTRSDNKTPTKSSPNRVENPSAVDEPARKPVSKPGNKGNLSSVKPQEKPKANGDTKPPEKSKANGNTNPPDNNTNPRKKPRILSHNGNPVSNKQTNDPKRPKSESDAGHNVNSNTGDVPGTQKTKKKKHKWVPPKWKGHF